ncbi:MAG: response regulator [Pseudomonadota bacterium]
MKHHVLIIEDDDGLRTALAQTVDLAGFNPIPTASFLQARRTIRSNFQGVILSDIKMPNATGLDVLAFAQSLDPDLPVILMTGHSDVPTAMAALKGGAYDYLEKPCAPAKLVEVLTRSLDHRALVLRTRKIEAAALRHDAAAVYFPGGSAATVQWHKQLRSAAQTDQPVHMFGDQGVGKRTAAFVLSTLMDPPRDMMRASGIGLTPADVRALPWSPDPKVFLLKAASQVPDAVGDLIKDMLARHPDTRLVTSDRLGTDVLGLNADAPIVVRVPSLQDRRDDLDVIFGAAVRVASRNLDIDMPDLKDSWRAELLARPWDGNMVELRQFASTCVLTAQTDSLPQQDQSLAGQMDHFERMVLIESLKKANGRAGLAAQYLDLPRNTFYDRLARHGLKAKDFKA